MADFLIVFVVTFLVIAGVTVAMIFGGAPVYRPDQQKVQNLLTRLLENQLSEQEWQFFLDMPIQHDPDLESMRQKCVQMNEEFSLRARNGLARLKEPGLIRVRHWLNQIEQAGFRSF